MNPAPSRRAFTLVELLSVIAIVGVLAAIILSVTVSSRERANVSRCSANLRQIGLSVQLYAADNQGWLPLAATPPNNTSMISRDGPLASYWGPYGANTALETFNRSAPVRCPTVGYDTVVYVFNVHMLGYPGQGYKQRRLAETVSPAGKIIGAEGTRGFASTSGSYIKAWNEDGVLIKPHDGALNVLFLDAHVERRTLEGIAQAHVRPN